MSVSSKSKAWLVDFLVVEILAIELLVVHELVAQESVLEAGHTYLGLVERSHCRGGHLVQAADERDNLTVAKVGFEAVLRSLSVHIWRHDLTLVVTLLLDQCGSLP